MKATRRSQRQKSGDASTGAIKSKSIQSLGWIDKLLGDTKAREAARKKAEARSRQARNAS